MAIKKKEDIRVILSRIEKKVDELYNNQFRNKSTYNFKEACIYLGCKAPHLYKQMHFNLIDYSKPGGKLAYFTREALDEFLQRNTMKNIADLPKKSEAELASEAAIYAHTHNYIK